MIRLAVIGNPVGHSRSPEIHQAFARQAALEISYEKIEAPLGGFVDAARAFIESGARGFNVTVPFKVDAFGFVDNVSRQAELAEAVNTISIGGDASLSGDNTDGGGIVADLEENLGWRLRGKRLLILGAGGAVRGVLPAILEKEPLSVSILNRTHDKAVRLESLFSGMGAVRAVTEDSIQEAFDLVISGSSAGLAGAEVALPAAAIGSETLCYDMIYSASTTSFNSAALELGCGDTSDGLGMLVEQAALSFNTWCEFTPKTRGVIDDLRKSLE
jgi:shikimate dehydrogenase